MVATIVKGGGVVRARTTAKTTVLAPGVLELLFEFGHRFSILEGQRINCFRCLHASR